MTTKPTKIPCRVCGGYGYRGHTNPEIGERCWNCDGTGQVPVDEPIDWAKVADEELAEPKQDPALDEDPYANDAFKKYYDLIGEFTKEYDVRENISVTAHAHKRGVEVEIGERVKDGPFGGPSFAWTSTGKRNVGTMRELAQAILDACDFVDECNPHWASKRGEISADWDNILERRDKVVETLNTPRPCDGMRGDG